MSVYQHIQCVAKLKRISIRQIETELGFSNGSIRKWQDSAPTYKLLRVANYLGTTPDYLILGKKDNDKTNVAPTNNKIDLKIAKDQGKVLSWEGRDIPAGKWEMVRRILDGGK